LQESLSPELTNFVVFEFGEITVLKYPSRLKCVNNERKAICGKCSQIRDCQFYPLHLQLELGEVTVRPIKPYGEVEIELHAFLTSAPEKGDRSASCPRFFAPGKSAPLKSRLGGLQRRSGNLGHDTNLLSLSRV
jgi:hypothetical protein